MMKKFFIVQILILILGSKTHAYNNYIELQIPSKINSDVIAVMPDEKIIKLGKVLQVPTKINYPAYTASKWSAPSTVCASAVNAVHILINVENDRGKIISLVPSVTVAPAARPGAYYSLEMPAGSGIFGGYAPFTGSKVTIKNIITNSERDLDNIPGENEILIIRTDLPAQQNIYMADFENRPGGRVIIYKNSGPEIIARVIRPVKGSGRFLGGIYQDKGRIRASHSGVIDVTTSKYNQIGGFQIIPLNHALYSHEMINAWKLTQWMIISPLPNNLNLEGHEPLFKKSLLPGTSKNEKLNSTWSTYGRKPLILCRISGGNWQKLPEATGRNDQALNNITHFRIYFPFWFEPGYKYKSR